MKDSTKKEIGDALKFDAFTAAEDLTGKSYKNDKETESLGFAAHIANSKRKEMLLSANGDTCFSETEESYLKKVEEFGFKSLLVEPFINKDKIEERLHIMFHYGYSILLVWDTHTWGDDGSWAKSGEKVPPPSRNGGKFYYNWLPNNKDNRFGLTSSGGYTEDKFTGNLIWCGDHDCREGLKHNINNLAENGTFLGTWIDQPFLWLLHYMDTEEEGYDYEAINKNRIEKLPEDVQRCIKGAE